MGTKHRNHCPLCLWSKHVDNTPGDRKSFCGGKMKPIGLKFKKDGELMIVHECLNCKKISCNRIAGDDFTEAILNLVKNRSGDLLAIDAIEEIRIVLFGKK